ncbi:MAG TPA: cytochrome c oxidase assembly protein [Pseudomonadales bacterium]|nr:cytochrome c oxidase assembly protein [Pseudomonadales bacterium]
MNSNWTVAKLIAGVVGMFVFAVGILPPLYDAMCELTGLNGKTGGRYDYVAADLEADEDRQVQIRFVTNSNAGMPWGFGADTSGMKVSPGGKNQAIFHASNPTDRVMVAQTIPSITPGRAAAYFHKTQCFCFDQQVLQGGEAVEMPVVFIVDRDLPDSIGTITLSYTMFDITDQASGRMALEEYETAHAATRADESGTAAGG